MIQIFSSEMHNFFRKLSIRRNKSPDELAPRKRSEIKKKSSGGLFRFIRSDHRDDYLFDMPMEIMLLIIDQMSFFEQIRLSKLNKTVKAHMDEKFSNITKLECRKRDIDSVCEDKAYQRHHKSYVAVKIDEDSGTAHVVIDCAWVVSDFHVFLGIVEYLRHSIRKVDIDAPLAELIIISLSEISLDRWYAFQSFLKLYGDDNEDMHLDSPFIADRDTFWPKLCDLSVYATKEQAGNLGRILDYGVKSGYVFDRRMMDHLKLEFEDLAGFDDKAVNKQIYYFRWVQIYVLKPIFLFLDDSNTKP